MRLPGTVVDELFRRHNRALKGLARRRVGHEDAEDIVQEAYLRLLQVQNAGQVTDAPSYLFRIASNVAIDWLRKRKSRSAHVLENVEIEAIVANHAGLATVADDAIRICRTQIRLSQLPRCCYDAFVLSRLYGLSYPEIAERLGVSLRTVNRNISRAVVHLEFPIELEANGSGAKPEADTSIKDGSRPRRRKRSENSARKGSLTDCRPASSDPAAPEDGLEMPAEYVA